MVKVLGMSLAAVGLLVAVGVTPATAQKKDRNLIMADEIKERSEISNAYDAVRMLRSPWLRVARSKGGIGSASFGGGSARPSAKTTGSEDNPTGSIDAASQTANNSRSAMLDEQASKKSGPVGYIDDVKVEELEDIRNVKAEEVVEIRYMNGNDASGRYGAGHESGAILVKTNRIKH